MSHSDEFTLGYASGRRDAELTTIAGFILGALAGTLLSMSLVVLRVSWHPLREIALLGISGCVVVILVLVILIYLDERWRRQ